MKKIRVKTDLTGPWTCEVSIKKAPRISGGLLKTEVYFLHFIRNSQPFPSFGPASLEHFLPVDGRHPLPESVFVLALPVRWLKCSFHFMLIFGSAKIDLFLLITNYFAGIFFKVSTR